MRENTTLRQSAPTDRRGKIKQFARWFVPDHK